MTNAIVSTKNIPVAHVTITSTKSFDEVRSRIEAIVPQLDSNIWALLQEGSIERLVEAIEAAPPLTIFLARDHGALLQIADLDVHAVQYDIGNPLTASKMTRQNLSTGLYAPVRVLLSENPDGIVAFEYDRPVSTFGQFGNETVDAVAQRLDADLQAALVHAAT